MLDCGTHQSMMAHVPFLRYEFASMVGKGQWVVMPYLVYKELPGLRLSPPVVKDEQDCLPMWIDNYIYSDKKSDKLHIAALSAMQYGRASDRLIIEVVILDPAL